MRRSDGPSSPPRPRPVAGNPAGTQRAALVDEFDDVPGGEAARDVDHARRQQRAAAADRVHRTVVEDEAAVVSAAWRTQNRRDDIRSARAAKAVPTDASRSAVSASAAAASSTGMPPSAASRAAASFDAIPRCPVRHQTRR